MVVRHREPVVAWALEKRDDYEMVGQYDLPEFPTPIAVTDRRGRSKWTVSIPRASNFPLTASEYSDICAKCSEVAAHVRELSGQHTYPSQQALLYYHYQDPYFLDVDEAEKSGLLPSAHSKSNKVTAQAQEGHLVGLNGDVFDGNICKKTLTFVLESPEAGIGITLMMLWMSYGLAQREQRAFFIDDSRWAYGEYTNIFRPPPVPECQPPPRHEMLPCPHHARHLVVSVATAQSTFGNSFSSRYERVEKMDVSRERPVFDLARVGYEALFRLNDEDQPYVHNRVQELKAKAKVPQGNINDGTIIGVHVRHGDLHPYEYQYSGTYIPLTIYTEKAREIISEYHNTTAPGGGEDTMAKQHSFMLLASDDPDVYETEEFSSSPRAQEQIKLASKAHIQQANPNRSVMHKFVDETFGWEGGFFASMFWNLGRTSLNNVNTVNAPTTAIDPSAETMRLRGLIGRAYMMDLAVLGQASDVVVCTVSATGCRLVAVIMGWEKAMEKGSWVNIDGNYRWSGVAL